jgi:four helix bundle protein
MNHKDLDVWKTAMLLAETVYVETIDFPQHEQFGLTSQLRKAAVSVPANIAEGSARQGKKEFIQFLYVTLGSLAELETLIILSWKVGFLKKEKQEELLELVVRCSKLTHGLIKYQKSIV